MTPQQRMLAAIRGERPDRLPVATYNFHPFSWSGHNGWAEYEPMREAVRRTGAGMLCKLYVPSSGGLPEPRVTEEVRGDERITTSVLATPSGPLRQVRRKPPGQPARDVEPYIKTDQDIERFLSLPTTPERTDVDALVERCREIGPAGLAYVSYPDPFGYISGHFVQEDLLVRVVTDPAPVRRLLDRAFRDIYDDLKALLESLAPHRPTVLFHSGGPEKACPPLLSPAHFPWLVTRYQRPLVSLIHEYGYPVSLHCHGRVSGVLDEVLECGFDVLEPVEPPPQGDIDLAELRRRTDGRIALLGYVQDQEFYSATPRRMREHVAYIVERVGRGTRFIAAPTCTPFDFPPTRRYVDNYVAFLEAAAEVGS